MKMIVSCVTIVPLNFSNNKQSVYSLTDWVSHILTHPLACSLTVIAPSLTYSLARSLTHSLAHSLAYAPTQSLTHSLAHSLPRSPTHPISHSLTRLLTHTLTRSPNHSLAHSLPFSLPLSLTLFLRITTFDIQKASGEIPSFLSVLDQPVEEILPAAQTVMTDSSQTKSWEGCRPDYVALVYWFLAGDFWLKNKVICGRRPQYGNTCFQNNKFLLTWGCPGFWNRFALIWHSGINYSVTVDVLVT